MLVGVINGDEGWQEILVFGEQRLHILKKHLDPRLRGLTAECF